MRSIKTFCVDDKSVIAKSRREKYLEHGLTADRPQVPKRFSVGDAVDGVGEGRRLARSGRPGAAAREPISADFAAYFLRYSSGLARSNFLNGVKMM